MNKKKFKSSNKKKVNKVTLLSLVYFNHQNINLKENVHYLEKVRQLLIIKMSNFLEDMYQKMEKY